MAYGVKTKVEKHISKITYPTGTIRYQVGFEGEAPFYELTTSLEKAKELKATHLKNHPEVIPMDPEARRLRSVERSKKTRVPGTKFIREYTDRPGTYDIRIKRSKKWGKGDINLVETVTGLENAKKKEALLIKKMEKLTGRGIDVGEFKPPNPAYRRALVDVEKQMRQYKKLGYYPSNILVGISKKHNLPYHEGQGANRQLSIYVQEAELISKYKLPVIENSKHIEAIEAYKKYKGDKTKPGVKKAILDKVGLPAKHGNISSFGAVLKGIGEHVKEELKLPKETKQRKIQRTLAKVSALNIEDYLSGKKLGPLVVSDKKGSLIDKMHFAEKKGLITVGEMGYGSAKLNRMLGTSFSKENAPERHRTVLNKHISDIIKKFKGRPDALYEISKGPDSFDQRKFKIALQKEFGKTQGKIPLKQYIDKILNEEVRLLGVATDGLITTRQLDPVTLTRMIPSFGLSGTRTFTPFGKSQDLTTLQELGLEKTTSWTNESDT